MAANRYFSLHVEEERMMRRNIPGGVSTEMIASNFPIQNPSCIRIFTMVSSPPTLVLVEKFDSGLKLYLEELSLGDKLPSGDKGFDLDSCEIKVLLKGTFQIVLTLHLVLHKTHGAISSHDEGIVVVKGLPKLYMVRNTCNRAKDYFDLANLLEASITLKGPQPKEYVWVLSFLRANWAGNANFDIEQIRFGLMHAPLVLDALARLEYFTRAHAYLNDNPHNTAKRVCIELQKEVNPRWMLDVMDSNWWGAQEKLIDDRNEAETLFQTIMQNMRLDVNGQVIPPPKPYTNDGKSFLEFCKNVHAHVNDPNVDRTKPTTNAYAEHIVRVSVEDAALLLGKLWDNFITFLHELLINEKFYTYEDRLR